LICEREDVRQLFKPEEYWSLNAQFAMQDAEAAAAGASSGETFEARLVQVDDQRLNKMSIRTKEESDRLTARLWQQGDASALGPQPLQQQQQQQQLPLHTNASPNAPPVLYTVQVVAKKPVRRNPPPPLVTSTMQQEAARRLGFSATKTMQVAQQLYEGANTGKEDDPVCPVLAASHGLQQFQLACCG
jgi:DNA topoisomerase-1